MGNQKWASDDDAGDLLAGILDDTATEAEAEQERIAAEIKARQEEEQRKKEEEEAKKRAEAEARLSAEKERLQQVEKRRTQKLEALRIEDLKESGQWNPPEELSDEKDEKETPPAAAQRPPQAAAQPAPRPMAPAPEPIPQKSNTGLVIGLAALILAVVGAAVIAFVVLPDGYEVDNTTYAKTTYTPAQSEITVVELGFAPLPEKKVEEAPAPRTRRPTRTRRAPTPAPSEPEPRSRPSSSPGLDLDLDTDPFSAGH